MHTDRDVALLNRTIEEWEKEGSRARSSIWIMSVIRRDNASLDNILSTVPRTFAQNCSSLILELLKQNREGFSKDVFESRTYGFQIFSSFACIISFHFISFLLHQQDANVETNALQLTDGTTRLYMRKITTTTSGCHLRGYNILLGGKQHKRGWQRWGTNHAPRWIFLFNHASQRSFFTNHASHKKK